jgi:hypothetical protein
MKVSAVFNEQGLAVKLSAENDAERHMIGAVLNQPQELAFDKTLLDAEIHASSHFTRHKVDAIILRVHRYEGDE